MSDYIPRHAGAIDDFDDDVLDMIRDRSKSAATLQNAFRVLALAKEALGDLVALAIKEQWTHISIDGADKALSAIAAFEDEVTK